MTLNLRYRYHKDGILSFDKREVWVFGSNLAGVHGAGAAKVANERYGRPYGEYTSKGIYYSNSKYVFSYAIPTKDRYLQTLPLSDIAKGIESLRQEILEDIDGNNRGWPAIPELALKWFITRIGCGLAGYSDEEIAPMFVNFPGDCSFPIEWKKFLES